MDPVVHSKYKVQRYLLTRVYASAYIKSVYKTDSTADRCACFIGQESGLLRLGSYHVTPLQIPASCTESLKSPYRFLGCSCLTSSTILHPPIAQRKAVAPVLQLADGQAVLRNTDKNGHGDDQNQLLLG